MPCPAGINCSSNAQHVAEAVSRCFSHSPVHPATAQLDSRTRSGSTAFAFLTALLTTSQVRRQE